MSFSNGDHGLEDAVSLGLQKDGATTWLELRERDK